MPKRLLYDRVKEEFEKRGYVLLEEAENLNSNNKFRYLCNKHPKEELYISWGHFREGKGCKYCGNEKIKNSKLTSIKEIEKIFKDRGLILLDKQYTGKHLTYKCPHHPNKNLSIALSKIKSGQGCPYCAGRKIDMEDVHEAFEQRGYELLETEWRGAHYRMKYVCPYHQDEDTQISWMSFKQGSGCSYCAKVSPATFEEVKEAFKSLGYELLESDYEKSTKPMRFLCPIHPNKNTKMSYIKLKQGQKCIYCMGKGKRTIEDARELFEGIGYTLLEEKYKNASTPMRYQCPHHPDKKLHITYNRLKQGNRCPFCSGVGVPIYVEVKNAFKLKGLELLDDSYTDSKNKMNYRCLKHPKEIQKASYTSLNLSKYNCKYCVLENNSGENHHGWKQGISRFKYAIRATLKQWKKDSMKNCGYKCVITGERFDDIHHLYSFDLIVQDALIELGLEHHEKIGEYDSKEFITLKNKIIEIHYKHPLGVCMKKDVHDDFHKRHGYGENTPEQFEEFKLNYNIRGENK